MYKVFQIWITSNLGRCVFTFVRLRVRNTLNSFFTSIYYSNEGRKKKAKNIHFVFFSRNNPAPSCFQTISKCIVLLVNNIPFAIQVRERINRQKIFPNIFGRFTATCRLHHRIICRSHGYKQKVMSACVDLLSSELH